MICVAIGEKSFDEIKAALEQVDFAEIRLDKAQLCLEEVKTLFASPKKLIATCRAGVFDEQLREQMLQVAIEAGAAYVDLEVESQEALIERMLQCAKQHQARVIISYHNYDKTPCGRELNAVVEQCFSLGADLAKISCAVSSKQDVARLIGLLDNQREIIITSMGAQGTLGRLAAPLLGSPIAYACLEAGKETAAGQVCYQDMQRFVDEFGEA